MTTRLLDPEIYRREIHFQAETPEAIWSDIATRHEDVAAASALAAAVMGDIKKKKLWAAAWWAATRTAYGTTLKPFGRYIGESDHLAAVLGGGELSPADMAGLQRLYTFAHAGCSVVMGWDEAAGRMVHFRCLDWPSAAAIAAASRLYDAVGRDGSPVYRSAGVLGLIGCLTAVKPGFSASINFAPWTGPSLSPNPDPTFLLRQLMESPLDSYEEAKAEIERWRPSAPVFIALCGPRKGEACVAAFGAAWSRHRGCHLTEIGKDPWLVQTNHFDPSGPFAAQNKKPVPADRTDWDDCTLLQTSVARKIRIEEALRADRPLRQVYAEPPIWNRDTAQWVTMIPGTGDLRLEVRA